MPLGHPAAFYFDYERLQWAAQQARTMDLLVRAWDTRNTGDIAAHLTALGAPDMLVVPNAYAQWPRQAREFPYAVETVMRNYTIFRRSAGR